LVFRSISEVGAPSLPINLSEKDKTLKATEEPVKKVKKLSETTGEPGAQNFVSYVLPNEMENDIKLSIEKLVKVCGKIFLCLALCSIDLVNSIGSNNSGYSEESGTSFRSKYLSRITRVKNSFSKKKENKFYILLFL
jgi:hypothetical protein